MADRSSPSSQEYTLRYANATPEPSIHQTSISTSANPSASNTPHPLRSSPLSIHLRSSRTRLYVSAGKTLIWMPHLNSMTTLWQPHQLEQSLRAEGAIVSRDSQYVWVIMWGHGIIPTNCTEMDKKRTQHDHEQRALCLFFSFGHSSLEILGFVFLWEFLASTLFFVLLRERFYGDHEFSESLFVLILKAHRAHIDWCFH